MFLLLAVNISFATAKGDKIISFFHQRCFEIVFSQRGIFENETENYNGTLIKIAPQRWKIVYFTNPPFEVSVRGKIATLGYRGEEKETLNLEEYPNPVLEILLQLDHLREIFEIKPLGGRRFLLIPKGELSQYVEKAVLETDSKGLPKRLEVFGGVDNYLIITVSKIKPACGGDKIGKP